MKHNLSPNHWEKTFLKNLKQFKTFFLNPPVGCIFVRTNLFYWSLKKSVIEYIFLFQNGGVVVSLLPVSLLHYFVQKTITFYNFYFCREWATLWTDLFVLKSVSPSVTTSERKVSFTTYGRIQQKQNENCPPFWKRKIYSVTHTQPHAQPHAQPRAQPHAQPDAQPHAHAQLHAHVHAPAQAHVHSQAYVQMHEHGKRTCKRTRMRL